MSSSDVLINKKILVVDDDPEICEVYRAILSSSSYFRPSFFPGPASGSPLGSLAEGFDLTFASQGQEAYEIVKQATSANDPFAMACIDIRMPPGWDGVETAEKIRQIDREVEIVIVTGYTDHSLEDILARVGSPDKLLFLRKPFDLEELAQMALSLTMKWSLSRQTREKELALQESQGRFRDLSRRVVQLVEEERKRIARDLHDDFGQVLPSLMFMLDSLQVSLPPELVEQTNNQFQQIHQSIKRLGATCRNTLYELRPDMLDRMGMLPTIKWCVNEFAVCQKGVDVDFRMVGSQKELAQDIQTVVYRTFQEGLNNIVKHAQAQKVQILLTFSHPHVILTMTDDGVGFDAEKVFGPIEGGQGIGLYGMRERVESVSGSLTIHSQSGKGTIIRAELPVE